MYTNLKSVNLLVSVVWLIHAGSVISANMDYSSTVQMVHHLLITALNRTIRPQLMEDIQNWWSLMKILYSMFRRNFQSQELHPFFVQGSLHILLYGTGKSKEADAKKLGAHKFVLTTNDESVNKVKGYFDFILDTVSAPHDYNLYISLLKTDGIQICVGVPPTPAQINGFSLVGGRKSLAGSSIGGLPETQEMLDYCAEHNIISDVEVIAIKDVNHAYDRMLKGDVRYRFVIDMASL